MSFSIGLLVSFVVIASHTWKCPSVRGEGPEAREGHSATLVGKRLFVFGGCGKSSESNDEIYYNDLYILNTGTVLIGIFHVIISYALIILESKILKQKQLHTLSFLALMLRF